MNGSGVRQSLEQKVGLSPADPAFQYPRHPPHEVDGPLWADQREHQGGHDDVGERGPLGPDPGSGPTATAVGPPGPHRGGGREAPGEGGGPIRHRIAKARTPPGPASHMTTDSPEGPAPRGPSRSKRTKNKAKP